MHCLDKHFEIQADFSSAFEYSSPSTPHKKTELKKSLLQGFHRSHELRIRDLTTDLKYVCVCIYSTPLGLLFLSLVLCQLQESSSAAAPLPHQKAHSAMAPMQSHKILFLLLHAIPLPSTPLSGSNTPPFSLSGISFQAPNAFH